MKKSIIYFISLVSFLFGGCNNSVKEDNPGKSDVTEVKKESTTWQEQLDYAKQQSDLMTRNGIDGLKLVKYSYRGKVETQEQREEFLKLLFADDTDVVYHLNDNKGSYDIVPLKVMREKLSLSGTEEPFEKIKEWLKRASENENLELVNVEWSFHGRSVHSVAVISPQNNTILFDHIGGAAIIPGSKKEPKVESTVRNLTKEEYDAEKHTK